MASPWTGRGGRGRGARRWWPPPTPGPSWCRRPHPPAGSSEGAYRRGGEHYKSYPQCHMEGETLHLMYSYLLLLLVKFIVVYCCVVTSHVSLVMFAANLE